MQTRYKAFWLNDDGFIDIIDQTKLPFEEKIVTLQTSDDVIHAIKSMQVRGAGVIGNIASLGIYLASLQNSDMEFIRTEAKKIRESRPTAVNLMWAVDLMMETGSNSHEVLLEKALSICDIDAKESKLIAEYGCDFFENILEKKDKKTLNVLTHCNAGWLAIVDDGSALAPIYEAQRRGIAVHVWVDETRPRNQGANLTAWELAKSGIKHTIIADNTGGYLMQQGMVDVCIVGADRVSANGDVANKIGTYLKALSAKDNDIPFLVALPLGTFDLNITDGVRDIPIEIRDEDELRVVQGVEIYPPNSPCLNYGFDITPARLITGLVTKDGIIKANESDIRGLFL
ncbi:MAG: S-methyl-5-thioribose-1-phosphate isomerase [Sulfurovum sp.]